MSKELAMRAELYRVLRNYCIVFGKVLSWEEVNWHVKEDYRFGIINKAFTALRDFGSITIRVNDKNNEIPYPKIVCASKSILDNSSS